MVKREGMENLLLSYYEGETTEDETALVEEWLEASEENRRTARQVQTLGLAADMAQISSRLDVKKALEDVHRKMKQKKVNRYQVLLEGCNGGRHFIHPFDGIVVYPLLGQG